MRHNKLLAVGEDSATIDVIVASIFILASGLLLLLPDKGVVVIGLFVVMLLIALYLIIKNSMIYYMNLRNETHKIKTEWYYNLYE